MHKHFRMIALSEYLRNHGYDPRIDKHTRIPGIWEKLGTLYNMEIIDARESSFDDEDGESHFLDFELPEEDYGLDTFMRGKRDSSETPSSPPRLPLSPSPPATRKRRRGEGLAKTRASTVDTDEARTSPAPSPPAKATRSGRSAHRLSGRAKAEPNSRPASKDTMDEDEGAEETEETAEDDEPEAEEEERSVSPKAAKGSARSKSDAAAKTANPSRKSKRKR
jgi:MRG-binding protein